MNTKQQYNFMRRSALAVMIGVAVMAAAANAAGENVATLRDRVEVTGASVTLGDVANVQGDYAQELGSVEVATFAAGQADHTLTMRQVRDRLTQHGVHWGRLMIRGASSITLRRPLQAAPAPADESLTITDSASPAVANPLPAVTTDPAAAPAILTLRQRITQWVRERVAADPSDLKITFEDSDDPLLRLTATGVRFEFEPLSRDTVGRVPIAVRRYEGGRLAATDRVRVNVRIRRPAVVAVRSLERGQTITDADVQLKPVWLESLIEQPLDALSQVVGLRAVGVVRAEDMLHVDDVRPPILVERGQLVTVRCVSGGLVLKTVGRAMEDGEGGQIIPVRNERTRELFHARVSGPREAVLMVSTPRDTLAAARQATGAEP